MISCKMIRDDKLNRIEYYVDVNNILNEFYLKSTGRLDNAYFFLKYNNQEITHYFGYFIDKDYDYSEDNYYIYKIKLNNYYLIQKFFVLGNKPIDIYFEFYKENNIHEINKEKETLDLLIFETHGMEFPKLSNEISKIDTYIESIDIFKDPYTYDRIYVEDLEVYKFAKMQKIIIPEKYLYNFKTHGYSFKIKRTDMEKLTYYKVGYSKMPINEIKVM